MPSRTERLEAALLIFGLVNQPATNALEGTRDASLLTAEQWDAYRALEDDDIALARACIEVEREIRDRQWTALELLCHAYTGPDAPDHTDPHGGAATGAKPTTTATASPAVETVPRAAAITFARTVLCWCPNPGGA